MHLYNNSQDREDSSFLRQQAFYEKVDLSYMHLECHAHLTRESIFMALRTYPTLVLPKNLLQNEFTGPGGDMLLASPRTRQFWRKYP